MIAMAASFASILFIQNILMSKNSEHIELLIAENQRLQILIKQKSIANSNFMRTSYEDDLNELDVRIQIAYLDEIEAKEMLQLWQKRQQILSELSKKTI